MALSKSIQETYGKIDKLLEKIDRLPESVKRHNEAMQSQKIAKMSDAEIAKQIKETEDTIAHLQRKADALEPKTRWYYAHGSAVARVDLADIEREIKRLQAYNTALLDAQKGAGVGGSGKQNDDIPYEPREKKSSLIGHAIEAAASAYQQIQKTQAAALQKTLDAQREWASKMVESMEDFGSATLEEVKSQISREREARDKDLDDKRTRYEKLAELGNIGFRAMTGISMFKKPAAAAADITAGDFTRDRISKAVEALNKQKETSLDMTDAVNAQLGLGDMPERLSAIAGVQNPEAGGNVVAQVNLLGQIVMRLDAQLRELQKLTLKPVMT